MTIESGCSYGPEAVTVRSMTEGDWRLLRDMRLRMLREDGDAFGSNYEREAAFTEGRWRRRVSGTDGVRSCYFVVERVDAGGAMTPMGMAAGVSGPDATPGCADLVSMWVASAYRGRGFGERLVRSVSDWAAAEGFRAVRLVVHDDNVPAQLLYERCGFGVVSTGGGEHGRDTVMELLVISAGGAEESGVARGA